MTDISEQKALDEITKELQISWKKLAKHSMHLCYEKLGKIYIQHYFDKLEKSESHKNRPFTVDED